MEKAGFATMISLTRSLIALVISLVFLTAVFGGESYLVGTGTDRGELLSGVISRVISIKWYRKKIFFMKKYF